MKILTVEEVDSVVGGGGLDYVNDAARALGGAYARAIDKVQTKAMEIGATVKANLIQSHFE